MEKLYECIAIFSNEEGDNLKNNVENFKGYFKGVKARFEEWGDKKFAYSIGKHTHGYYMDSKFIGTDDIRDRIVSAMVNDKNIIKHIVVLYEVGAEEMELEIKKIEDYMQQKVVYVLLEEDLEYDCGSIPWFGVLGVFGNLEEAKKLMEHKIRLLIENHGLVEDEENKNKDKNKILFQGYQENWNNYVEFKIQDYIVE